MPKTQGKTIGAIKREKPTHKSAPHVDTLQTDEEKRRWEIRQAPRRTNTMMIKAEDTNATNAAMMASVRLVVVAFSAVTIAAIKSPLLHHAKLVKRFRSGCWRLALHMYVDWAIFAAALNERMARNRDIVEVVFVEVIIE